MNEFITIIVASILILSVFMYYEERFTELSYTKSTVDNKEYLVRNREDKQDAANLLANVGKRLNKLVKSLVIAMPDDKRIQRLENRFKPEKISETISNTNHTSYSVNKGEKIVFCIRTKDEKEELIDINTILFVGIHELAHVMTESIGHTDEFWNNMKLLLRFAVKKKIYEYVDYNAQPVPYCGTTITDSPYRKE